MGDPKDISKRVRNLDGFFHPAENLMPYEDLPEYDYATREYDNFSIKESPSKIDGKIVDYTGSHPDGILEWFGE
jgi:hypothetical protein